MSGVNDTRTPVVVAFYFGVMDDRDRLSKPEQKAFDSFLGKLKRNPKSSSLNSERIRAVGRNTKEIRSMRVTDDIRAVVVMQAEGVYCVMHVGHHEDAYAWVKRHSITEDMLANTIRVEEVPDPDTLAVLFAAGYDAGDEEYHRDYLKGFADEDLESYGVPAAGIPILRAAPNIRIARSLAYLLPENTRALVDLALQGNNKTDIASLMADEKKQGSSIGFGQSVSSAEFIASGTTEDERRARSMLTSNGSQQQFVVLTDDDDLQKLLDAPLAQWRVFLHPTQRSVVDGDYSGPARVSGGAGTGKTVVAMHRARRLAQSLIQQHSDGKVLLTTFTRNLADGTLANMRQLCTDDELQHIEVVNLDKWLVDFLKQYAKIEVTYKDIEINGIWGKAIEDVAEDSADDALRNRPIRFFRDEWERVVMANGIATLDEYLGIPRRGRGERLTRQQRRAVWAVLESYRRHMASIHKCDKAYGMGVAANLMNGKCRDRRFEFIVVDEGQDFDAPAYRLLRGMVGNHPNDLFIAGDNHQQIYGNRVSLKQCGISIAGRSFRLKVNYRTTAQIKNVAENVFRTEGADVRDTVIEAVKTVRKKDTERRYDDHASHAFSDASEGLNYSLNGVFESSSSEPDLFGDGVSLTQGEWPEAQCCKSWDAQVRVVHDWIQERLKKDGVAKPEYVCIIVRSKDLVRDWVAALNGKYGCEAVELGRADVSEKPGIRVSTMHRAKGLEFDYVVVADIDKCPPAKQIQAVGEDKTALAELYKEERNLLYVAMTRPRKELLVTAVR